MPHFPVTSSVLSAAHLAAFIQAAYTLPSGTVCDLIRSGINDTYLVTAGSEKFVFRVYSLGWRTVQEIEEEIRLLTLIKENGIAVSYPLANGAQQFIQSFDAPEGRRYGVLFSFAAGEKVLQYPAGTHFAIGELMGRLHRVTLGVTLNRATYTPAVLLTDPFEHISKFLPADTAEMAFMRSAQAYLQQQFAAFDLARLRTGAVHLDIWFDNLNINSRNEATIFDFDFCGNGWLCLDIAYYIMQVHTVEKDEAICAEKVKSFLQGYESITAITAEEKRIIPMLGTAIYIFYLGVQCYRFNNWSNVFLNTTHLRRVINMVIKPYYDKHRSLSAVPVSLPA